MKLEGGNRDGELCVGTFFPYRKHVRVPIYKQSLGSYAIPDRVLENLFRFRVHGKHLNVLHIKSKQRTVVRAKGHWSKSRRRNRYTHAVHNRNLVNIFRSPNMDLKRILESHRRQDKMRYSLDWEFLPNAFIHVCTTKQTQQCFSRFQCKMGFITIGFSASSICIPLTPHTAILNQYLTFPFYPMILLLLLYTSCGLIRTWSMQK